MSDAVIKVVVLLLFIVTLPYSLALVVVFIFLALCLSPTTSSRYNKKVEKWSRKRKRYY